VSTATRLTSFKTRVIALALAFAACLAIGVGVDRADAMTPAQTTESGVVNLLDGSSAADFTGSIEDFWRQTLPSWGYNGYTAPAIQYYGDGAGGHYDTSCGSTSPWAGENGFYCAPSNTVYLDYSGQQGLLSRLGDHAAGGFLAHEWGHRAQAIMDTLVADFRKEYNADCLAGLYTRFGYDTGRLSGDDFWEFYNWLNAQPASDSHGTGPNRASWYQYGYTQFTKAACDATFQLTSSGASAATAGGKMAAARALQPPALDRVDTTPRRSNALPPGSKRIAFGENQQQDPHTPAG
jgi:Putative neutral zinc metallopeptidase